jgi:hypothetical protein
MEIILKIGNLVCADGKLAVIREQVSQDTFEITFVDDLSKATLPATQLTPDLFEHHEYIPSELQEVLDRYEEKLIDGIDYNELAEMVKACNEVGYTFEYYLDAEPYFLRKSEITLI